VKLAVRAHATYFVFGDPEQDSGKPNRLWRDVGQDLVSLVHDVPWIRLELFPLRRGPSGSARFLAKFIISGCAGSIGVTYEAREWSPQGNGALDMIIKQEGSFGLDDKTPGLQQIGKLQTGGSRITLPYCWFSAIDTWDNPSLCAVDTYDLSGDDVRFHSRVYNRPDLVPIAKAVEYAQQRDYPAVFAYCASSEVARKLVRDVPPRITPNELRLRRTAEDKEHVELGFDPTCRFDIEMRDGRWLIVAFNAE